MRVSILAPASAGALIPKYSNLNNSEVSDTGTGNACRCLPLYQTVYLTSALIGRVEFISHRKSMWGSFCKIGDLHESYQAEGNKQ